MVPPLFNKGIVKKKKSLFYFKIIIRRWSRGQSSAPHSWHVVTIQLAALLSCFDMLFFFLPNATVDKSSYRHFSPFTSVTPEVQQLEHYSATDRGRIKTCLFQGRFLSAVSFCLCHLGFSMS